MSTPLCEKTELLENARQPEERGARAATLLPTKATLLETKGDAARDNKREAV
jgi:hypothetical protein